jgi:GNAT superfamily N-acetyltransferase
MVDAPGVVTIRRFHKTDSIEELTDLLHRAYRRLADMDLRFLATHQDRETTLRRTQTGICLIAEIDGRLVGTVTYYDPEHTKGSPWLDRDDVAHFGQLAVEPALQGRGIGRLLIDHVEAMAVECRVNELALDTAEPARHLIEWYQRLGYRFIEYVQWEVTNYRSVVMSKAMEK